jgi:hypothetical protein
MWTRDSVEHDRTLRTPGVAISEKPHVRMFRAVRVKRLRKEKRGTLGVQCPRSAWPRSCT